MPSDRKGSSGSSAACQAARSWAGHCSNLNRAQGSTVLDQCGGFMRHLSCPSAMGAGQTRPRAPASRCDHVVIPAESRGILHVDIGFHRRLQRLVAENPPCGLGILGMRVEIELRGEVAEEMCAAAPAAGLEGTRQGGPVDWLEVLPRGRSPLSRRPDLRSFRVSRHCRRSLQSAATTMENR